MECIGKDFEGWPIYKLTLREILQKFGATLDACGKVGFDDDDPTLDKYPEFFIDDGMGYSPYSYSVISAITNKETGMLQAWLDINDSENEKDKEILQG